MLIDFHTHIFPSAIAERVLKTLCENTLRYKGVEKTPCTDGTIDGLRKNMRAKGVDISVVMPIATKITQSGSINKFAEQITSDDVISFGSLHPFQNDWVEVLEILAEKGFKGIKLHPQYQQVQVDSDEMIRVLKKAEELKLYTTLHTGADHGVPPPDMCTPLMLKHVLEEVSGKYLVAAHLGSMDMWDDVEKYLVGTDMYFDTAAISNVISKEQYARIIKSHGADRILFASDSPWEDVDKTLVALNQLDLDEAELEKIKYKNALKILGIKNTIA